MIGVTMVSSVSVNFLLVVYCMTIIRKIYVRTAGKAQLQPLAHLLRLLKHYNLVPDNYLNCASLRRKPARVNHHQQRPRPHSVRWTQISFATETTIKSRPLHGEHMMIFLSAPRSLFFDTFEATQLSSQWQFGLPLYGSSHRHHLYNSFNYFNQLP